jgi:hypothetical protein
MAASRIPNFIEAIPNRHSFSKANVFLRRAARAHERFKRIFELHLRRWLIGGGSRVAYIKGPPAFSAGMSPMEMCLAMHDHASNSSAGLDTV